MRILAGVCLTLLPFVAGSIQAQSSGAAGPPTTTLKGIVTDSAGRPLAAADVRLMDAGTEVGLTRSNEDGSFVVAGIIRGRSRLQVKHVGFKPGDVELFFPRDSTRLLSIELDPESVGAQETDSASAAVWLQQFNERRRTNTMGYYFTRDEIVSRRPQYLSELLRSVPGVTISRDRAGALHIQMRGCRYGPIVWIDGIRTPGAELDEVARVDDAGAMEVYISASGVPAQYLDRSNVGCGTILVWTRL